MVMFLGRRPRAGLLVVAVAVAVIAGGEDQPSPRARALRVARLDVGETEDAQTIATKPQPRGRRPRGRNANINRPVNNDSPTSKTGSRTARTRTAPEKKPPKQERVRKVPSNVVFLHIPKTAGATIERVLGRRESPGKWHFNVKSEIAHTPTTVFWHTPPRFFAHNPFRNATTFCVVREPLDRALSEFKMFAKTKINSTSAASHFLENLVKKVERPPGNHTFDEGHNSHYWPQFLYVWDARGRCTCDHVLRYEKLAHDFDALMIKLNATARLSDIASTNHHLPSNLSVRSIDPDLARRVRRAYAVDMTLFGFGDACGGLDPDTSAWQRDHASLDDWRRCVPVVDAETRLDPVRVRNDDGGLEKKEGPACARLRGDDVALAADTTTTTTAVDGGDVAANATTIEEEEEEEEEEPPLASSSKELRDRRAMTSSQTARLREGGLWSRRLSSVLSLPLRFLGRRQSDATSVSPRE